MTNFDWLAVAGKAGAIWLGVASVVFFTTWSVYRKR